MKNYPSFSESMVCILKEANIKNMNELVLEMAGIEKTDAKKMMEELHSIKSNECIMECGNKKTYFCIPCGHLCYCQNCWNNIEKTNIPKTCPICRIQIDKAQEIQE